MIIRRIRQEDDKRIAAIIRGIFDELDMPKEHTVYDEDVTDHQYEVFRDEPRSVLWVAEENGIVVGSCGTYPTEGLPEGWCEIVKFYVDKCARGNGIGTQLFTKSLESAWCLGYQTAYLETFPKFGNAIGLYHRLGFRDIDHQMGNSGHTAMSIYTLTCCDNKGCFLNDSDTASCVSGNLSRIDGCRPLSQNGC